MKKICVLKGDGIGPEIVNEAVKVLKAVGDFEFTEELIGGCAIEKFGKPLPDKTLETAKNSDAVLLGAVGDWKYDKLPPEIRPEKALLGIRKTLGLFANLRPVKVINELASSSPLKAEIARGTDIMIVRELTGGIYFGEPRGTEVRNGEETAYNTMVYSVSEIKRIAKVAFESAMKRNKKVCSVDKANVLDVSRLWRRVMNEVSTDYPEVELTHMYVDNAAMQLVVNPKQFDVLVTSNLFGDILSDEGSVISGSLGLLPSASLSAGGTGMFEPCHGSAPDMAGLNKANPLATILSASMLLRYGLNMSEEADKIENAVNQVIKDGYRTEDIYNSSANDKLVGTSEMGDLVVERIK